ncbi:hypothetical protein [Anaerofustis sp. NSJ-163]|uniref:hypothetical protein n=1 Tax=Anaerofustis sp. NSJ-163 TaxID=2944391 RepID=UPI00209BF712|nr:hypothetical protein [Anaerofustis sp. NSJ-163]MCO8193015.1 hypothetical protein [Anaerofustis sp. NSJ-163]
MGKRKLNLLGIIAVVIIILLAGIIFLSKFDIFSPIKAKTSDLKAYGEFFYNNIVNYEEYPQFNYEREILDRIFDSEKGSKKALKGCSTEIKELSKDDKGNTVRITISQCDFGFIYKNALEKANEEIANNNITNKKEKNDILNKYLIKEYEQHKNKKINETFIEKPKYTYSLEIQSTLYKNDNTDYKIYSALLGGLSEAMEENPCDYLILKSEYKFYEDIIKELYGYVDEIKDSDRDDLTQCRDIINTIGYLEYSFDDSSRYHIIHPIFDIGKDKVTINFNTNSYYYAYRLDDYIHKEEKNDEDSGLDMFYWVKYDYDFDEYRKENYYFNLKYFGSLRTYQEIMDTYGIDISDKEGNLMIVQVGCKEEVDENGESHFSLVVNNQEKEDIYNQITGKVLEEVKQKPCKYYDKKDYKIYRQFDKQLEEYVKDFKEDERYDKYKDIIKYMFKEEDFNDINDLIIPSYIIDEKEHKVVIDFHPYSISYYYEDFIEDVKEREGSEINSIDSKEKAIEWLGETFYKTREMLGENAIKIDYIEKTDEKGNVYYELVIDDEIREQIYKQIIDNLDETMKENPCEFFEE